MPHQKTNDFIENGDKPAVGLEARAGRSVGENRSYQKDLISHCDERSASVSTDHLITSYLHTLVCIILTVIIALV